MEPTAVHHGTQLGLIALVLVQGCADHPLYPTPESGTLEGAEHDPATTSSGVSSTSSTTGPGLGSSDTQALTFDTGFDTWVDPTDVQLTIHPCGDEYHTLPSARFAWVLDHSVAMQAPWSSGDGSDEQTLWSALVGQLHQTSLGPAAKTRSAVALVGPTTAGDGCERTITLASPFGRDSPEFSDWLANVEPANQPGRAIVRGLHVAIEALEAEEMVARRVVTLITSGRDDCAADDELLAMAHVAAEREIGLEILALNLGQDNASSALLARFEATAAITPGGHVERVDNTEQLRAALTNILDRNQPCRFATEIYPIANPRLNTVLIERVRFLNLGDYPKCMGADGWRLTNAEHSQIELCGQACETARAGEDFVYVVPCGPPP